MFYLDLAWRKARRAITEKHSSIGYWLPVRKYLFSLSVWKFNGTVMDMKANARAGYFHNSLEEEMKL